MNFHGARALLGQRRRHLRGRQRLAPGAAPLPVADQVTHPQGTRQVSRPAFPMSSRSGRARHRLAHALDRSRHRLGPRRAGGARPARRTLSCVVRGRSSVRSARAVATMDAAVWGLPRVGRVRGPRRPRPTCEGFQPGPAEQPQRQRTKVAVVVDVHRVEMAGEHDGFRPAAVDQCRHAGAREAAIRYRDGPDILRSPREARPRAQHVREPGGEIGFVPGAGHAWDGCEGSAQARAAAAWKRRAAPFRQSTGPADWLSRQPDAECRRLLSVGHPCEFGTPAPSPART